MDETKRHSNGLGAPEARVKVSPVDSGDVRTGASTQSAAGEDATAATEQADSPSERAGVKDATQEVVQDARDRSREVAERAGEQLQEIAKQLQQGSVAALEGGKTQLAEQIHAVARAFKRGGEQLRDDNLGGLAELSDDFAEQADAVQRYLKEQSGDALLRDLRRFAGQRRALFVGSLFVTGLVAARFMQSDRPLRGAKPRVDEARLDETRVRKTGVQRVRTGPAAVPAGGRVRSYTRREER